MVGGSGGGCDVSTWEWCDERVACQGGVGGGRGRVWIFLPFYELPTGGSDSVGYGGLLMECGIKVHDLSTCHVAL